MNLKVLIYFLLILCYQTFSKITIQQSPKQRAQKLLEQMSIDEKINMVHGWRGPYVGNVIPNKRLNIPILNLEDGPQGVADGILKQTCWPSALTVVATWDLQLMEQFGIAMAKEQRGKGTNIMLGPMVNIARVPMGGRNFESFGEDPYLSSVMAAANIKGIQSQGVIATVKHYVNNNQENNRNVVSANVDERTQWEIYYPAFKAAIDAGVGAVMCSYNRINNTYACENYQTLTIDLKERMGFEGFVMSDWGATHSTIYSANNGLDMEMPDDHYFGSALKEAIQKGKVSLSRLNDMVMRILTPMFTVGLFDTPQPTGNLSMDVQSREHNILARKLAEAANVLLKNENNTLPLKISQLKSIAVIGDDGHKNPIYAGGGSGHVIASYVITPLQGIQKRVGDNIKVNYAPTLPLNTAMKVAQEADVAIVFVGTNSQEGSDRPNLSLENNQDELIKAVSKVQKNVIVVVHTPGAVLMPWVDQVKSIICAFMPGQEDGNAIASVLFGDINPGGKLPLTFPYTQEQIPVNTPQQYPGINGEADYSEKLLVGYRWYDAKKIKPLFPFGYGLSYTTFEYSNLKVTGSIEELEGVLISLDISNTGLISGSETIQLYIGYPPKAGEPPKVLRRFHKIHLLPGERRSIIFQLNHQDVSIWDIEQHKWIIINGNFHIYIGSSSEDIHLQGTFEI